MDAIRVHQIWLPGRGLVPADLQSSMQTWVEATRTRRTYRYELWDGESIAALLAESPLARIREIYRQIPPTLYGMRADIARLVLLFHFGGLYADADTRVLQRDAVLDFFERALLVEGADAVVGVADQPGWTRWWVQAARRPGNFLLGCAVGSVFVARYLDDIVHEFETLPILRDLSRADRWPLVDRLRVTKRWTGPRKLRALIACAPPHHVPVRLTPLGFVASGYQRCFPDAALAHDYQGNWYEASPLWRRVRDAALYALLNTPLDACIIAVLVAALCVVIAAMR